MRRLLKTSAISMLFALLAVFTFSACSNHKNKQQTDPPAYNEQSSTNDSELLLGKVINAQTGQAVANANVVVKFSGNKNNGNLAVATTNRRGLFMVTGITKGKHVIIVKKGGYQRWKNTVYVPLLNKKIPGSPFNGFFRPSPASEGWLHGVFQTNKDNNRSSNNVYEKSLFLVIGLQMK